MANDAQIERLEYLQQYSSYLGDIRDSTLVNIRDINQAVDQEFDNLCLQSNEVNDLFEEARKILGRIHDMQDQKNPADIVQYQKLCMLIEETEEVYQKMNKSFDMHEEKCSIIKRDLSELSEQTASFKKNIMTLIETGIDVVRKSIEIIERYNHKMGTE